MPFLNNKQANTAVQVPKWQTQQRRQRLGAQESLCSIFSLFSPAHHSRSAQNSTNGSTLQPENPRHNPPPSPGCSRPLPDSRRCRRDIVCWSCPAPPRPAPCQLSRSHVGDTEGLGTGRFCLLWGTLNQQKFLVWAVHGFS